MRFERHTRGTLLIWQRVGGPFGYASMAGRPFAEKAFRVQAARLIDVTPEFAPRPFSDENPDFRNAVRDLTPERLLLLRSDGGIPADEQEGIVSALLARALQHVFCRQVRRRAG